MERLQKSMFWAIVLSETSHVFCCALPTLFSVLSLLSGLGLVATLPPVLVNIHDVLHAWEIPMIAFSGAVIVFGWVLFFVSRKIDCHNTGCVHEPCGPRKKNAHTVLKIATALFLINVAVYAVFHRGMDAVATQQGIYATDGHENHAH